MTLPQDNLNYPTLLTWNTGSGGSGFLVNNDDKELFLVTAKHVLTNEKGELFGESMQMYTYAQNNTSGEPLNFTLDFNRIDKENIKFSSTHDVAIIKIATLKMESEKNILIKIDGFTNNTKEQNNANIIGVPKKYFKKFAEVGISNDVFITGYPISIGDGKILEQKRPLLRKGIVAGKNMENKTIVLDCPVYQGNSGGIVLEVSLTIENGLLVNKISTIGVISKFVPFYEIMQSLHFGTINKNTENSGYSIIEPIDAVIDLMEK